MTTLGKPRPTGRMRAALASERVYRSLLRAYPREFRNDYGDEMAHSFRDLCREELHGRGGPGLAALWTHTLPELLRTALKERTSTVLTRHAYRTAVGVAVATALLLVWVNLAVGVIGSEDNPANLMYFGVLAAGVGGAVAARFRPQEMARALVAVAIAQALVPAIALAVGRPEITPGVLGVLGGNALFVALWVGSAVLFRRAATNAARGT